MKYVPRFLAAGFLATLVLQFSSALAFHEPGHIPPTGTCRDDPCPCSKADEDKIKGLIGRLRALKEVADQTRKEYNDAVNARDKERDGIWGASGSGAVYINSLVGMASISPTAPNWIGWANAGIGMGQGINQGSIEWDSWLNVGTQVVGDDHVITNATEIIIKEGTESAV